MGIPRHTEKGQIYRLYARKRQNVYWREEEELYSESIRRIRKFPRVGGKMPIQAFKTPDR